MQTRAIAPPLFGRRKFWARRFGTAAFLPTSRAEMDELGWDSCDVIIVSGDAYVDHVSFGAAVIGRVLEHQGYRVGILAQPDWTDPQAFLELGVPNLMWGITGGNMDSLVNHYTSDRKRRSDDAYTPEGAAGQRPDRAVIIYAERCREAMVLAGLGANEPAIVLGGIEASLRRIAHYDYWSDQVRRSVLIDSKADILVYGNAERSILEIAERLAKGEPAAAICDIRGTAVPIRELPAGFVEIDSSEVDQPPGLVSLRRKALTTPRETTAVRLPAFEVVRNDKVLYAHASRVLHQEANPHNGRVLVQRHGNRDVWINPPPIPLETPEMDAVFELPYQRRPHPRYRDAKIPAYEMIKTSVMIMRGCFGGCSFCSITEHEGRIIQSRSKDSVLREIEQIRDTVPGFTGVISDVGGPTANMWRLGCKDPSIEAACRRPSCVYPGICENLNTDHSPLIQLYREARALPGVKKILVASGLRYDLAVESPEYVRELVTHHVGGYLKIAPEHVAEGPLSKMMKPGVGTYERFKELFDRYSEQAGKQQFLIPYFIAAHPGTTDEDMLELALWLKGNGFRADQVQAFLPSPMATATTMYHTGRNPLKKISRSEAAERVEVPKGLTIRRLHKAFLRYHDPNNWPVIREALRRMGREDLIGAGKKQLVPSWQPVGTGLSGGEGRRGKPGAGKPRPGTVLTQHTGLPPRETEVEGAGKPSKPGRSGKPGKPRSR